MARRGAPTEKKKKKVRRAEKYRDGEEGQVKASRELISRSNVIYLPGT